MQNLCRKPVARKKPKRVIAVKTTLQKNIKETEKNLPVMMTAAHPV